MKNMNLQTQEAQQSSSRINKQIFTKVCCSHTVERQNEAILKAAAGEKPLIVYGGRVWLLPETVEARRN